MNDTTKSSYDSDHSDNSDDVDIDEEEEEEEYEDGSDDDSGDVGFKYSDEHDYFADILDDFDESEDENTDYSWVDERQENTDEPYFENEIYGELGYSYVDSIYGGQPEEFTKYSEAGAPCLGHFIDSFPRGVVDGTVAQMDQPLLGGDAALPKEDTYKPVAAVHYEMEQNDEFWDFGVRKWGIGMVKPENVFMSVYRRPRASPPFKTKYDDAFRRPYKNDLEEFLDLKNQQLLHTMSLSQDEKEAYRIAEVLDAIDRDTNERGAFWRERRNISEELEAWKDLRDRAWNGEDRDAVFASQKGLRTVLALEAKDQAKEAVRFMKSKSKNDEHNTLLKRMNSRLRQMTLELKEFAKESSDRKTEKAATELRAMLNITFMVLEGKYSGPEDPETMLADKKTDMNAEATNLEAVSDPEVVKDEDAEIEAIAELAITAIKDKNEARCYEMGHYLFKLFAARPLVRNIGMIVMAHDSSRPMGLKLCELAIERLDGMKLKSTHEEQARLKWIKAGKLLLDGKAAQPQILVSPCGKRKREREPSESPSDKRAKLIPH